MATAIAFLGFGEAASVLARGLREGGASVVAYDVLMDMDRPDARAALDRRAEAAGVRLLPLADAIAGAGYVLSAVVSQVAVEVAATAARHLGRGQIYLDLNSTAPSVKRRVAEAIAPSRADFVEGAILGAIGVTGAKTRILTGGPRGQEAAAALGALGLNIAFMSAEVGRASTFKMLRSIFSKGVEALLVEMLVSGEKAGIRADLWKDVTGFMAAGSFDRIASNWIATHAPACERRHHEMIQVVETMRELDLDPIMTSATVARFERSRAAGLPAGLAREGVTADDVIDYLGRHAGKG